MISISARASALAIALAVTAQLAGASFRVTPDFSGGYDWGAARLMSDGKTIKGITIDREIFRWTSDDGYQVVDTLPELFLGRSIERAYGMSADGSTVFGRALSDNIFEPSIGYYWTVETGIAQIQSAPGEILRNIKPTAASPDGSVIVGVYGQGDPYGLDPQSFIWQADTNAQVANLPGYPHAVSADGSTIVGSSLVNSNPEQREAFRWSRDDGALSLGVLPNSWQHASSAGFASADGSVIAGYAFPPDARVGPKSFRWTAETGMEHLGTLGDQAEVYGMSSDGRLIVGSVRSLIDEAPRFATFEQPFVWTERSGMRFLHDVLTDLGVTDDTWFGDRSANHYVFGASPNGRYLFGSSVLSSGPYFDLTEVFVGEEELIGGRQWIVDLSPLPEPGTFQTVLIATLLAMCLAQQCRWRTLTTTSPPRSD